MKRWLFRVVILLFLLAVGATVWFQWRARTGMPALDGAVSHPSLKGTVTVKRDDWGVPHIYADHETDAYFALGYAQAQDRLFQMELMRRLAQGELAELLGPVMVPKIDAIARSFRLLPKAKEHQKLYENSHPEIQAMAEAYCAGVNHFVDTGELPIEFTLLGIPRRHYTPADCMSVAAILPISFADGLREDGLQSAMKQRNPDLDTDPFFPGYLQEPEPVTVMETIEEAVAFLQDKANGLESSEGVPAESEPAAEPPVEVSALSPLFDALGTMTRYLGFGMGSNSWVVSGSHSASGKPMLANDPHIAFFNPSIWYEAQIECPTLDIYGYHLPLIPITLIGHNRHMGWTLTMLANDDVDLFQETFKEDDPGKVMYKGEWVDAIVEEQTIKVRFGEDVTAQVRVTNHGPIITDLLRLMQDYEGPDVAMSWVWQHLDYTDLLGFYKMARSKTMEEFRAGVALITSPGLNVSYADAEGNIAWWAASRLPVRRPDANPKVLLDGASGKDEILGYLPFDENPHLINPPQGFIVTANNWSTVKPLGPNGEIPYLPGYFQPQDRAGRLEQLLATKPQWTLEEMKAMQFDDVAYTGAEMRDIIVGALDGAGASLSPIEAEALKHLREWDLAHGVDSIGASLYWVTYEYIFKRWAGDHMTAKELAIYDSLADSFNAFKHFMRNPELPGWDDVTTPEPESRDDILVAAYGDAVQALLKAHGDHLADWAWGKVHTMEFKHPLGYLPGLNRVFNIGPFPATGSQQVVNNMLYNGSDGHYSVIAGPSTRRVVDFAQPDKSYSILPTGNSGHLFSPHYDDQAPLFMAGKFRELRYTREQVDANTLHTMTLGPQ